jgi:hypothetical protein
LTIINMVKEKSMRSNGKLFAVCAMTGALAVTGVGVGIASSSAKTHTLRVKSTVVSEKVLPGGHFVDADKDTSKGKYVGTDAVSGAYLKKTNTAKGEVAFALSGGIMYANIAENAKTGVLTGKLTGGAGKFKGISGTVKGTAVSEKSTDVTVIYSR